MWVDENVQDWKIPNLLATDAVGKDLLMQKASVTSKPTPKTKSKKGGGGGKKELDHFWRGEDKAGVEVYVRTRQNEKKHSFASLWHEGKQKCQCTLTSTNLQIDEALDILTHVAKIAIDASDFSKTFLYGKRDELVKKMKEEKDGEGKSEVKANTHDEEATQTAKDEEGKKKRGGKKKKSPDDIKHDGKNNDERNDGEKDLSLIGYTLPLCLTSLSTSTPLACEDGSPPFAAAELGAPGTPC